MKKRILCAVLAALCLAGCGTGAVSDTKDTSSAASGVTEFADSISPEKMTHPVSDKAKEGTDLSFFVDLAGYKQLPKVKTENGSITDINFDGTIDGEEVDGMSARNYSLTIGSGTLIPGFEDALIGHSEGETFEFDLAFPDPYTNNADLSGKVAHWTVTINDIENEGYMMLKSVEEKSEIKSYPKDDYDEISDYVYGFYKNAAETNFQMELADFVKDYQIDMVAETDQCLSNLLVAEAIMGSEGLTTDSEEYKKAMDGILADNNVTSIEEATESGIPQAWLRLAATRRVAYDILQKYAA